MRTIKKIILPTLLLTGALAVGALGISKVSAQDTGSYPPVVQKLAERFGLDVDDVESVFEEERANRHAEMLTKFEDRLSEAVENGKITEAQKQAIIDKHEEMESRMEELRNLSPEERKTKMDAWHSELKAWAESQNIDLPFMEFGKGFGKGFKEGFRAGSAN